MGAVAGLADDLQWLPPRPLAGLSVAVTRARAQASGLARRLAVLGANVIEAPTIRTRTLDGAPLDPTPYDLICLTSANGVERLFERLAAGGRDARSLAGAHVAAIGSATARALAQHGIVADVVPERFVAESLVEALSDFDVKRALVATASGARAVLPDALRERGAQVDVLVLYETLAEPLSEQALQQARTADYVVFTSSSSVRYFLDAPRARAGHRTFSETHAQLHDDQSASDRVPFSPSTRIVSIGPVTSATLRERGLEPHVEAERHDIDGLVDALLADASPVDILPSNPV